MDLKLSQATRAARLTTPLGEDALVIVRFDATEGLSELFEFRIEALSKQDVNFDDLLGRSCTVEIKMYGRQRHFTGILVEGQWTGMKYEHHVYQMVLRPWLWLHSRTSDCRIFQNKTAPDIIKEVLAGGDIQFRLQDGPYPELEYCVQYRETDLAFVSRLMEHHGIYYFFKHSAGNHALVLADSMSSHEPVPGLASIPFIPLANAERRDRQHIYHWIAERRFRTGKVMLNDYYELEPNADLKADKKANARYSGSDLEHYDYPGKYKKRSDGEKYAKVVLEAEQSLDQRRHTAGNSVSLFPGGTTMVERHPKGSENQEFLIVRASHSYVAEHYRSEASLAEEDYHGNFELLPKKDMFRAQIVTPRPLIHGSQTAVVTGPKGEEIYVDEYGRIKVQFHWDRYGKKDEKSSRWIRVAERWSGKKWGTQETPRIGMEVLVEFLEGDPDQPLVAGTVYNGGEYRHPFELPTNKTQSGIKSESSKGGGGFNQLRFEDKKNFEEINLHAQKDYQVKVLDTEVREIGQRFTGQLAAPNSRKTTLLRGDDELTIAAGNQTLTITFGQTVTIGGFQSVTVSGPITVQSTTMLTLMCGASMISMTPASIVIKSPTIIMASDGPLLIKGTPVAIAGAAMGMTF